MAMSLGIIIVTWSALVCVVRIEMHLAIDGHHRVRWKAGRIRKLGITKKRST